MAEVQITVAQMQIERDAAAARLLEIEPVLPVATIRVEVTARQLQTVGFASVKAEGPGASAASVSAARQALTVAEHANRDARAAATSLAQERDRLKFRIGFLEQQISQAQERLMRAGGSQDLRRG